MIKVLGLLTIIVTTLLLSGVTVLAATTPSITANAATYVAQTTAQLNASVNDDGGEDCSVRWGWDTVTRALFADYANKTSWDTTGYATYEHPITEIDTLTPNDEYFWAVQIKNSEGTEITSSELSFTTELNVAAPANLIAFPGSTEVELSWTKGIGSSLTVIRYSEIAPGPTSVTDGVSVYIGALSNSTHTDLSPGHTYYYSAWGRSGANDSATYITTMATTTAEAAAVQQPDPPVMPPTWFQSPDYTVMSNLPLYNQINALFDSYELPRASGWFFSTILSCMGFSLFIYSLAKKPTPPLIALTVSLSVGSLVGLLPLFMTAFEVIFIVGAWQLREGRR